jgi:hypothetical protein
LNQPLEQGGAPDSPVATVGAAGMETLQRLVVSAAVRIDGTGLHGMRLAH